MDQLEEIFCFMQSKTNVLLTAVNFRQFKIGSETSVEKLQTLFLDNGENSGFNLLKEEETVHTYYK